MARDLKVLLRALVSSQTPEAEKQALIEEQLALIAKGHSELTSLVEQFSHLSTPYTLPQQVAACGILVKCLNYHSQKALLAVLMGHSYAALREAIYAQLASEGEGGLRFLKEVYGELKKKERDNEIESLINHLGRATAKEGAASLLINIIASDPYGIVGYHVSNALSELAPSVSSVLVNALSKAVPGSNIGNCLREVLTLNPRPHMSALSKSILRKPQAETITKSEPARSLLSSAMSLFRSSSTNQTKSLGEGEDYTRENTILVLGALNTRRMHALKLLTSELIDEDHKLREMVALSLEAQLNLDATSSMLVPRPKPAMQMDN